MATALPISAEVRFVSLEIAPSTKIARERTIRLTLNLSARRRAGVLTDLAVSGAHRHDTDQLVRFGLGAVAVARQTGSAVVRRRLQTLRPHLAPMLAAAPVRDLDEQISRLSASHTG